MNFGESEKESKLNCSHNFNNTFSLLFNSFRKILYYFLSLKLHKKNKKQWGKKKILIHPCIFFKKNSSLKRVNESKIL